MKIAIFSDIHGNLPALEAVITDIRLQKIEQMVCLGDICLLGPQPAEALRRLKELGCPVVMGNTDHWSLDPNNFERREENATLFFDLERWAAMRLSASDREFIHSFKPTIEIALPAKEVLLCCHGTPHNFIDQISTQTSQEKLVEIMNGVSAEVVACGHTHAQLLRRVGRSMVINPGSVGRPVEIDPLTEKVKYGLWAEYAILEAEIGQLAVTFRRVTYDINKLFLAARVNELPHIEHWLTMWKSD
jgi:putative phosphoesterase